MSLLHVVCDVEETVTVRGTVVSMIYQLSEIYTYI